MAKKKITAREQHREFAKAARELGAGERAEAFDTALKKIASPPPRSSQHLTFNHGPE